MRQLKITRSITNRESQSMERYLQEIGKVDLITAEEEVALAIRIKSGDDEALEALTNANLRFVVSVAKQYQNKGLSLPDLINEGNLGLITAAKRFDETRGFKFISYAVWWIRQSILQALAEHSRIVRLPLNKVGSLTKINRVFSDLEQYYEREPTYEELAESLDLPLHEVISSLRNSAKHVSMDAPFRKGEDGSLLNVLASGNTPDTDLELVHHASLRTEVENTLRFLTLRQASVLRMFYGLGKQPRAMTLGDIGVKLGLTRERVRQIKDKAVRQMRIITKKGSLRNYLGR